MFASIQLTDLFRKLLFHDEVFQLLGMAFRWNFFRRGVACRYVLITACKMRQVVSTNYELCRICRVFSHLFRISFHFLVMTFSITFPSSFSNMKVSWKCNEVWCIFFMNLGDVIFIFIISKKGLPDKIVKSAVDPNILRTFS